MIYLQLFLMGLASSFHCFAMCGGLIAGFGLQSSSYLQILLTNLGRICCYALLGLLVGIFGEIFNLNELKIFRYLAAFVLIATGFYLLGFKQINNFLEKLAMPIWQKLSKFFAKFSKQKDITGFLLTGFFWGFLPCGLVYSALTISLSANNIISASLAMFCFGLGTVPVLFVIGLGIKLLQKKYLQILSALIIIILGIISIPDITKLLMNKQMQHKNEIHYHQH